MRCPSCTKNWVRRLRWRRTPGRCCCARDKGSRLVLTLPCGGGVGRGAGAGPACPARVTCPVVAAIVVHGDEPGGPRGRRAAWWACEIPGEARWAEHAAPNDWI